VITEEFIPYDKDRITELRATRDRYDAAILTLRKARRDLTREIQSMLDHLAEELYDARKAAELAESINAENQEVSA
jgi:hypothetical protein